MKAARAGCIYPRITGFPVTAEGVTGPRRDLLTLLITTRSIPSREYRGKGLFRYNMAQVRKDYQAGRDPAGLPMMREKRKKKSYWKSSSLTCTRPPLRSLITILASDIV